MVSSPRIYIHVHPRVEARYRLQEDLFCCRIHVGREREEVAMFFLAIGGLLCSRCEGRNRRITMKWYK